MSAAGLYRALGLDGYEVLDTWESDADGRVRVLVEAPREALRCRACGCSRVHVHDHAVRTWLAAPIGITPVEVVMHSPRVKCLSCGAKTWHQPLFANGQRHSPNADDGDDPPQSCFQTAARVTLIGESGLKSVTFRTFGGLPEFVNLVTARFSRIESCGVRRAI